MTCHGTTTLVRAVRAAPGHRYDRRPVRPPTPRARLLERLSDEHQQIYWCLAITDGEGLTMVDLAEMTTMRREVCLLLCLALRRRRLIRCDGGRWYVVPETPRPALQPSHTTKEHP